EVHGLANEDNHTFAHVYLTPSESYQIVCTVTNAINTLEQSLSSPIIVQNRIIKIIFDHLEFWGIDGQILSTHESESKALPSIDTIFSLQRPVDIENIPNAVTCDWDFGDTTTLISDHISMWPYSVKHTYTTESLGEVHVHVTCRNLVSEKSNSTMF
ncbi:unnamed protein product, partial [Owenia fusiformis]